MGSVYRCHNAQAPRILAAIKVLERSLRSSDDAVRRFVREAEILHRLDHPNVVRVRNVRMDHDPPFIEMDFVGGESLEQLVDGHALPLRQAFDYMEQLVDALVYIHSQNVRHRDIKPANLLINSDGLLKLVDFGLAVETDLSRITEAGMTFGTVSYAPPEWIDPGEVDPVQWDLYASGVVFYEMITGLPAFPSPAGGSPKQQAMHVMLHKQSAPALDVGEPYPRELRALVRSLTSPHVEDRPSSAVEVREHLRIAREVLDRRGWDVLRGPLPSEVPTQVPPTRRLARRAQRRGRQLAALFAFAGLAVLGVAGMRVVLDPVTAVPPPPPRRDVLVALDGSPDDYPLHLRLAGQKPLLREAGGWLFEQVPTGEHELVWVAGEGCAPGMCTDENCPDWCGAGTVPLPVVEGEGVLRERIILDLPTPSVVVSVPSIQDVRSGLFRRRTHHELRATLDGRLGGSVSEHRAGWKAVVPGRRRLVVSVGDCPPRSIGCWPGECPSGCRSTVREVVVPFDHAPLVLSLDLPAPER